jgi:long-subunit fatty acid transport protein
MPMKTRCLAIALLLLATPALGQLESPLLSKIRLNLVNPGGKSLAMGGAFVALADDATAALANPAGLTQLTAWQVGGSGKVFFFEPELRRALYSLGGDGTYQKFLEEADRPKGRQDDLEFASVVGPLGDRMSVAVYRAVNLRYRLDANELSGGNYRAFALAVPPNSAVTLDEQGGLDLRSEVWGVSLATNLGALSVGGGLTFNRLRYELTGSAAGGGHLFITNADSVQGVPGAQPRLDTTVSSKVTSGTKTGWVAGFKWQVFEVGNVTLGGVYRKAPRFEVDYSVSSVNTWNGARVSFSCGVDDPNVPGSGASACGSFDMPDDWSVGVSAQLHPNVLPSSPTARSRRALAPRRTASSRTAEARTAPSPGSGPSGRFR